VDTVYIIKDQIRDLQLVSLHTLSPWLQ